MVEIYQLLLFSAIGTFLYFDLVVAASSALPLDKILMTVFAIAALGVLPAIVSSALSDGASILATLNSLRPLARARLSAPDSTGTPEETRSYSPS